MVAPAMKHMASNCVKLDKFDGVDFRRWQKNTHFLLSSMSVVYVLTTPIHKDGGDNPTVEQVRKRAKRDNDDYVCRGLILNDSDKSKGNNVVGPSVVNMVEHNNSSKYNDNKGKRKHHDNTRVDTNKTAKPTCWKCGKTGHTKRDCKSVNIDNKANGSGIKGSVDGSSNSLKGQNMVNKSLRAYYVSYVSEAYFVQDDDVAWWVKSGGTVHACEDRCWLNILNDNIASAFMSTFKLNDSILWHARLGHVHFKRMQDMSKDGLILAFDLDTEKWNKKYLLTFIDDALRTESTVLRVWACRAVVRLLDSKLKTLGERGIECIFVGYAKHSKSFRFYVIEPNDSVSINSITESNDTIFDENIFSSVPKPSLRISNETKDIGGSVVPEDVTEEVVQQPELKLRKSKKNRTPKNFIPEFQLYLIEGTRDEVANLLVANGFSKKKLKVDGTIEKFKARLVIQGFKRKSGMDYYDTYAPVARISTIRLLIAMASIHNLIIHQMDVKTSFLNVKLKEKVYMNQPQGFIMPGNENKVDLTNEFLSSRFFMKDMGEADIILDIRIKHEISTLMDTSEKLMPNNGPVVSQLEYTNNPVTQHWQAIQMVLKYLKKTMEYRLTYTGYPSVLKGYTDASWISNTEDNSSTSGWVFLLGDVDGKEAEWLKNLLLEIPSRLKHIASISICCDSASTLAKAYSQMYDEKSRHLDVRHSIIRELITNGMVSIEFVRSQQNLVDHLTKRLARNLVIKSAEGMGLKSN
nr:zinc finger, CCHC-type [Tanacetum cinerariifolium]